MEPITRNLIGIDARVLEERRAKTRHRVFKGGVLSFNNGYGAFECVVRNLSTGGAKLAFGDTTAVPPRFDLHISGEAEPRAATVCWRSLTELGVRFDDPAEALPAA